MKYGNPIRQCRGYNSNGKKQIEYTVIRRSKSSLEVIVILAIVLDIILFSFPSANKNTLETVQYGVEGSTAFLECQARSPHVSIKWHFQKENSDRRREVQ